MQIAEAPELVVSTHHMDVWIRLAWCRAIAAMGVPMPTNELIVAGPAQAKTEDILQGPNLDASLEARPTVFLEVVFHIRVEIEVQILAVARQR